MRRLFLAGLFMLCAEALPAHDGENHAAPPDAPTGVSTKKGQGLPLPFDLGGAFSLTDQTGKTRTEADPQGRMQLLFFGYANCEAICSVALPLMADVTDLLAARAIEAVPVMITIDPVRDTIGKLGPALTRHHDDFVGLTGSDEALAEAYKLYAIEREVAFVDPELGPVFAHGSHIYLLDGEGQFLTLLPPVLSADRLTEIVAGFAPS